MQEIVEIPNSATNFLSIRFPAAPESMKASTATYFSFQTSFSEDEVWSIEPCGEGMTR